MQYFIIFLMLIFFVVVGAGYYDLVPLPSWITKWY